MQAVWGGAEVKCSYLSSPRRDGPDLLPSLWANCWWRSALDGPEAGYDEGCILAVRDLFSFVGSLSKSNMETRATYLTRR